MNKKLMELLGFKKEVELVEQKKCPFCKKPIRDEDFEDEISRREYKISGLCQRCQDEEFIEDTPDLSDKIDKAEYQRDEFEPSDTEKGGGGEFSGGGASGEYDSNDSSDTSSDSSDGGSCD